MKNLKTLIFAAAFAVAACAQAQNQNQPVTAPAPPTTQQPVTTTATMNCSSDRLFVFEQSQGAIWQFCTGSDGKLIGFPMAWVQNVAQLHHQADSMLEAYGSDGVFREYAVIHGQPYYFYKGDWPIQQGGRIGEVTGNALSITFPWQSRSGQVVLWAPGSFSYNDQPQPFPSYYVLTARNAAGLYGLANDGKLYHHDIVMGQVSQQPDLVMTKVASIAAPSPQSPMLLVAVQAEYACPSSACKPVVGGSIMKVTYDRWSATPYTRSVVMTGVYPATMWPNTVMAATESSVYFIEQHPTAGSRVLGYSWQNGSAITVLLDKNSDFFQNGQNSSVPVFGAIALAAVYQ